ncbi:hypothetical protein D3C86_2086150 [compost metagenome]
MLGDRQRLRRRTQQRRQRHDQGDQHGQRQQRARPAQPGDQAEAAGQHDELPERTGRRRDSHRHAALFHRRRLTHGAEQY